MITGRGLAKFLLNGKLSSMCARGGQTQTIKKYIQRVSEISTLILTSDSSRQEQQNFYVSFLRSIIFISIFFPP
jgi:hypothetical protein